MAEIRFELNRLTDYSDEEIIREIQHVAAVLNVTPLTAMAFNKESKVKNGAILKRFGGRKKALEAAGLGHLYSRQLVTRNMREQLNRRARNDELLNKLRRVAKAVGRNGISSRDLKKRGGGSMDMFSRRFDSWEKAVKLAGLELRGSVAHIIFTHEDLFRNLLSVWTHCGRQPHYSEMNLSPSTIKSKNYTNRFGTWRKALLTFIDYMNRDSEENLGNCHSHLVSQHGVNSDGNLGQDARLRGGDKDEIETGRSLQQSTHPVEKKGTDDSRSISLGLRFKVMYRDHFKCVLCGNNPPASPGLILYIDHITPWSKDGKTVIDNLRTLCEPCNLGRGNRYMD